MKKKLQLLVAFLVGGLIFGTVTLFVAPQSGEDTRYFVKKKARKAKKKTLNTFDDTKDQINDLVSDTSKQIQGMIDNLNHSAQKQVEKIKDRTQQLA